MARMGYFYGAKHVLDKQLLRNGDCEQPYVMGRMRVIFHAEAQTTVSSFSAVESPI